MGYNTVEFDAGGKLFVDETDTWDIRVFTIRKSDAFLSDHLTDLKLHSTK